MNPNYQFFITAARIALGVFFAFLLYDIFKHVSVRAYGGVVPIEVVTLGMIAFIVSRKF